jgi:hypothetical protein
MNKIVDLWREFYLSKILLHSNKKLKQEFLWKLKIFTSSIKKRVLFKR